MEGGRFEGMRCHWGLLPANARLYELGVEAQLAVQVSRAFAVVRHS